ncbi:unnamed protein product, partial [Meganyctiphanes norvegica]
ELYNYIHSQEENHVQESLTDTCVNSNSYLDENSTISINNNSKDIQIYFSSLATTSVATVLTQVTNLNQCIGLGEDINKTIPENKSIKEKENIFSNFQYENISSPSRSIWIEEETNDDNICEDYSEIIVSSKFIELQNLDTDSNIHKENGSNRGNINNCNSQFDGVSEKEKIKGKICFYDYEYSKTKCKNQLVSHNLSKIILNTDINDNVNMPAEVSEIHENLQKDYIKASNVKQNYTEFQCKRIHGGMSHITESTESLKNDDKNSHISPKNKYFASLSNESHSNNHQCFVCKKILTTKSGLKVHMRIHSGERPFSCDKCSYGAVTLGNLKNHKNIHEKSIENDKKNNKHKYEQVLVKISKFDTQSNIETLVTSTEYQVIDKAQMICAVF